MASQRLDRDKEHSWATQEERAHEYLQEDIKEALKVLNPKGRRVGRIKQLEKDLNSTEVNIRFWCLQHET